MKFRHEYKHEISYSDKLILKERLSAIMKPDDNSVNGSYEIRSLYFDNLFDNALKEKIDGVNYREKFRIRSYNGNNDFIRLEKKSKINGLCNKQSVFLTKDETEKIINGDIDFIKDSDKELLRELYIKMHTRCLRPKTIVDYTRDAFIYAPGNVRVTLDYNIRTGIDSTDFLNTNSITIPAGDDVTILEVKWDEYLPDIIRNMVNLKGRNSAAFSKYAVCRIYG